MSEEMKKILKFLIVVLFGTLFLIGSTEGLNRGPSNKIINYDGTSQ